MFDAVVLHVLNGFVSLMRYQGFTVNFYQNFQDDWAIIESVEAVLDGRIPLEHIDKIEVIKK